MEIKTPTLKSERVGHSEELTDFLNSKYYSDTI
jgi:hypothetical protein